MFLFSQFETGIVVDNFSADRPLCEALRLMDNEGISSVAVVDSQFNVVGNISSADVKVCSNFVDNNSLQRKEGYLTPIAFDSIVIATSAAEHLHAFHLSHSVYTRAG